MKKAWFFGLLFAFPIVSMADYGDEHATICYTLSNNYKVTGKAACLVEQTGGAGVSVLRYNIKGANYDIVDDGNIQGISYKYKGKIISESYKTYLRDNGFKITKNENNFAYFCYKSSHVHFCSKQPN